MEAIIEAAKQVGGTWLLVAVLLVLALDKLGVFKHWLESRASRREQQVAEQTRIVAEQQRLVDNLRQEIDAQRRWRVEDEARHRAELDEEKALHAQTQQVLIKAQEALVAEQRNSSKWRHLAGNLAQHISALRFRMEKAGLSPPRFAGWEQFIGDGGNTEEFDFTP